nr:hypothetical protein GCM10017611_55100 [Rhodococcus wratislaviensis]
MVFVKPSGSAVAGAAAFGVSTAAAAVTTARVDLRALYFTAHPPSATPPRAPLTSVNALDARPTQAAGVSRASVWTAARRLAQAVWHTAAPLGRFIFELW